MTNGLGRVITTLKDGWKFERGDMPDAASTDFDDSQWECVRVPHDWAITGPFDRENDIDVVAITEDGDTKARPQTGRTGGLPHVGKAWYRLKFDLPEDIATRRVRIEFDGVMSHSKVYCNGAYVDSWPFGYASFAFDLTPHVRPGENTLAVFVDNKPHASRWYPGAGIYRHVRLVTLAPVHVAHWGTCVTTPDIDETSATVKFRTEIACDSTTKVELETTFMDPDGNEVASITDSQDLSADGVFEQQVTLANPMLWSIDKPQRYCARSLVKVDGEVVDRYETPFGIRSLLFSPDDGFQLNGERVPLNGVCMHHDLGPLGAAVNRAAIARQLTILKEMGCNAIRTSHNPPAPEFLELADEFGLVIIDEAFDEWRVKKCDNGYHTLFDEWAEKDLRAMIRRDRNHPCVIMWSLGNEVREQHDAKDDGRGVTKFLHDIAHDEDPTRPTTGGFNNPWGAIDNGVAGNIDVPGWNYQPRYYNRHRLRHPEWPVYGSETSSCTSSRGEFYFPVEDEKDPIRDSLHISSYDLSSPGWACCPDVSFAGVDDNPYVLGEFVWTGFDYLGEPTPYNTEWPSRSSYFGIIDLCGIPKSRFYLYQSRWADKETLHLVPHWTWPEREGETTPVHCYTSWKTVELFVNGVSQGKRSKHFKSMTNRYRVMWSGVKYAPGELKAVAYDDEGNVAKETLIRTAGAPAGLQLDADRESIAADGDDMAFVTVTVVDDKGNMCPRADDLVRFTVEGPAYIAAVGNGDQTSVDPFTVDWRKAFNGKCVVYLRSTPGASGGHITLKAEMAPQGQTSTIDLMAMCR